MIKLKGHRKRVYFFAVAAVAAVALMIVKGYEYYRGGEIANPSWEEYPVRGIDVSAHNGDIDFKDVKADGYSFAIIKATEGSAFKDLRFHVNVARARHAGLKVGAYHFFRFDAHPYMQALNVLHSLRGVQLDLPVVIDIEDWTNPNDRPAPRVVQHLVSFINELKKNGYKVMVYTNKQGYKKYVERRLSGLPLWICSFTEVPADMSWTFWQFTHKGKVAGVKGAVDIDIFKGNSDDLQRFLTQ